MTLLSQVNLDILTYSEATPVGVVLRKVKTRAYSLQVSRSLAVDDALNLALSEEYRTLREVPPRESEPSRLGREEAIKFLNRTYIKTRNMVSEGQIRLVLAMYSHLPDKDKVKQILHKFRGRVDANVVRRIVKERGNRL